jgi:hypothetical protein
MKQGKGQFTSVTGHMPFMVVCMLHCQYPARGANVLLTFGHLFIQHQVDVLLFESIAHCQCEGLAIPQLGSELTSLWNLSSVIHRFEITPLVSAMCDSMLHDLVLMRHRGMPLRNPINTACATMLLQQDAS